MLCHRLIQLTAVFTFVMTASLAQGTVIQVQNAGFEDYVLANPGSAANCVLNVPYWLGSGDFSTFKPGAIQYPAGVPGGQNVAAVGFQNNPGSLTQTLSATLMENTIYVLQIDVGIRADYPLVAYNIELLCNGITLASDSSLTPAAGTFLTDTITYNSSENPALLGKNLAIRISAASAGQANFDNVRLEALPVPEAASLGLLCLGSLMLLQRKKAAR